MMTFSQKRTNKQIISSSTMKILIMAAYQISATNHTEINPLKVTPSFDYNGKITRLLAS